MRVGGVGVGERAGVGGVGGRVVRALVGVLGLLSNGKEPREEMAWAKEAAASRGVGGNGGARGAGEGGREVVGAVDFSG